MALSHGLTGAGKLVTKAEVTFQPGEGITGIHLIVQGEVPDLDDKRRIRCSHRGRQKNCPVSQALTGTPITLSAEIA
jgi:lipoyl-dependent peroxiredoxin